MGKMIKKILITIIFLFAIIVLFVFGASLLYKNNMKITDFNTLNKDEGLILEQTVLRVM